MLAGLSSLFKVGWRGRSPRRDHRQKTDERRDDLHLDCFHVLAVVKSAATNIGVHASLSLWFSQGIRPVMGVAGSYGSSIPRF